MSSPAFEYRDCGYRTLCKVWLGAKRGKGYGTRRIGGRLVYLHRYAWEEAHGPVPDGLMVLHHCDVPACFEAEHLFLGTGADNARDAYAKGRLLAPPPRLGEANGNSRLTLEQVREIRSSEGSHAELGRRFGVSDVTIGHIRRGRTWREAA